MRTCIAFHFLSKEQPDILECPVADNTLLVVYIDNQSIGKDVWFDNLNVENYQSEVLEEDHYWPFGLTMNITPMQLGVNKNSIKFQSQQHEDDFGINMYSFKYRDHDPQIGRFWQIDPLAESYVYNSTYAFSENKVVAHVELEGLESMTINPTAELWRAAGITSSTNAREFVGNVGAEMAKPENILQAYGQAGQIAIPVILTTIMTGGMGALPMLEADVAYMGEVGVATENSSAGATSRATRLQANSAQGSLWENQVAGDLANEGNTAITEQVTIKANNGVKTRIDFISKDGNGNIQLTEAKSSATAPLTKNQKTAFPSIQQNGGVVVGQGKEPFPGGTQIPPTQVEIRRPPRIDISLE